MRKKNNNNSHTIHNFNGRFFHVKYYDECASEYKEGNHKFELKRMFFMQPKNFFLSAKETVALILGIRDVVLSITHTLAKL